MLTYLKKKQYLIPVIGIVLFAFLLGLFGRDLLGVTGGSLSGAAGALANQADCNTSSLSSEDPSGIILVDPLNLRAGPGLGYQVITTLEICTPVRLIGRSSNNAWLEVGLPGNVGGWVFAGYQSFPYVQTNVSISTLDITTTSGGPTTNTSPSSNQSVSVIIQANQVAAFVNGMPANTLISATLSPSSGGSGKSRAVASGQSDAQGNITLTFSMPTTWADGSAIQSGAMTLTLTGAGETMAAYLTYYTY